MTVENRYKIQNKLNLLRERILNTSLDKFDGRDRDWVNQAISSLRQRYGALYVGFEVKYVLTNNGLRTVMEKANYLWRKYK